MWTLIASDPIRDRLTAEIWTGSDWADQNATLVAEVFVDSGETRVELYPALVDARELRDALDEAIARISG
jgi:hypothetical protein